MLLLLMWLLPLPAKRSMAGLSRHKEAVNYPVIARSLSHRPRRPARIPERLQPNPRKPEQREAHAQRALLEVGKLHHCLGFAEVVRPHSLQLLPLHLQDVDSDN